MSYFKHMVSSRLKDTAFGNGGGSTVIWWLFNWIAINTTKQKKKELALSEQEPQVKYCNDFFLYMCLVGPWHIKEIFIWETYTEGYQGNISYKMLLSWVPVMGFHVRAQRRHPKVRWGNFWMSPEFMKKGASPGFMLASTSVNRKSSPSPSSPHHILPF